MTLIKRYVYAVGRRLPEKSRKDIEKELESLIVDALEARVGLGSTYSEDDVVAVLKEFGPPDQVAARYAPTPQYLIGPKLFPIYRLVVAIAVGASLLGLTIAFFVGTFENTGYLITEFTKFLGGIFSAVVSAVGSVTIIFAILERVLPDSELDAQVPGEPWDPRKLPPVGAAKDWGSMGKVSMNLAFTVLAMVVFNLYPSKIGLYFQSGADWSFVPVIAPQAISAYLPLWNIVWVLSIVHYSIVLIKRDWLLSSRILELVVSLANVVVLVIMATGLQVVDIQSLANNIENFDAIAKLIPMLDRVMRMAFAIGAVALTVETGVKGFKLVASQREQNAM